MANGPIIEEAPSTSGGGLGGGNGSVPAAAGLAGMPAVTSLGGGRGAGTPAAAPGSAPMFISSSAVPAPSEAAAAAFNAAAAAAAAAGAGGASQFVQMPGGADMADLPVLLPVPGASGGGVAAHGGMAQLPTTDNNPIVELPELDGLGLGGPVDLDLADMLPPLSPAAADLLLPTEQPSLGSDFWNGLISSPTASQTMATSGGPDAAAPAVPPGMVPLDAAFPAQQP